jgi:hypothetical protein
VYSIIQKNNKNQEEIAKTNQISVIVEKKGLMSSELFKEVHYTGEKIMNRGLAEDIEVDKLIAIAKNRNREEPSDASAYLSLTALENITTYSEPQRKSLLDYTKNECEYVQKTGKYNNGYAMSVSIMQNMKDKRAIKYFLPLCSSSNKKISDTAKNAVNYLQTVKN